MLPDPHHNNDPMKTHIAYMKQCIALGKEAISNGNPPVGALIVKNNTIIGRGLEATKSTKNITKHAEIEAVLDALKKEDVLTDCTLYTTHEPCIMCSYVIRHYNIATIVYGVDSKHVGSITSSFKTMRSKQVPSWGTPPNIIKNVMEEECKQLTISYNKNKNELHQ